MRSPSLWLGICAGMLMVLLMAKGFRGAIIMAILFATFISWIPGHGATYLGAESMIPCEDHACMHACTTAGCSRAQAHAHVHAHGVM